MTANISHKRTALQQEQARLLARLVEIEDELAGLEMGEAVQDVSTETPGTGQRGKGGTGWVEIRLVNGCGPYAYRRWYDGAKKRSAYLGKVMTK